MGEPTTRTPPKQMEGFSPHPNKELANALAGCFDHLPSTDPIFIVIGAHNGRDNFAYLIRNWQGIKIEPVAHCFEELKQNSGPRHKLEQVAIGAKRGTQTFYRIDTDEVLKYKSAVPGWMDYIGSLDPHHIEKHAAWLAKKGCVLEEQVEVVTLSDIIQKHGIDQIDYLQIDAEGSDFEILQTIDFRKPPRIILIEYVHMTDEQQIETVEILEHHGYTIRVFHQDLLAQHSTVVIPP